MTPIIIALILLATWAMWQSHSDDTEFLTATEFQRLVDASDYFSRMSTSDLVARSNTASFRDPEDYREWYKVQIRAWTLWERVWMNRLAAEARRRMYHVGLSEFVPDRLRFVKVAPVVELGYPHTLGDAIIWNERLIHDEPWLSQVELIIHEAIHIHQRHNPMWWHTYLVSRGYQPTPVPPHPLLRNNPDVTRTVWCQQGAAMGKCYRAADPYSLSDVVDQLDHPYEEEAYRWAEVIMRLS